MTVRPYRFWARTQDRACGCAGPFGSGTVSHSVPWRGGRAVHTPLGHRYIEIPNSATYRLARYRTLVRAERTEAGAATSRAHATSSRVRK